MAPPAAFNGQIRDKKIRVESVSRERNGWRICPQKQIFAGHSRTEEEEEDRNTHRQDMKTEM